MSANHSVNEFYDGSDVLSPFMSLTGLPIDQVTICRMRMRIQYGQHVPVYRRIEYMTHI